MSIWRIAILGLVISITLLSCTQNAKDPDCVSRVALTNLKLIVAAERGNLKIIQEMVDAGGDVNISDEVFGTPLGAATASARYEAVKLLLDKGADVNAADSQGYTPLMWAAQSGNPDLVRLFLSRGADPNASNKKLSGKFTALAIAKFKKNEEIVKLLEAAGAKE